MKTKLDFAKRYTMQMMLATTAFALFSVFGYESELSTIAVGLRSFGFLMAFGIIVFGLSYAYVYFNHEKLLKKRKRLNNTSGLQSPPIYMTVTSTF
ncbi:hypothetical protein [Pseudoalteromonas luteoviolacea]|uniref:Uncharacterized protein n=1 Tax=Pseudoalteromonas luteoviolacea NCIMB 1942 TaxID=1365253 RepID=A0A167HV05_9GAMM|nr:hypothetical protein [Pseudoalteromonas luteoviolacea]KZN58560.1 hypothetical protein N482_21765 [Pseudoalteromonas luteoviolacea NCIMB 1942]